MASKQPANTQAILFLTGRVFVILAYFDPSTERLVNPNEKSTSLRTTVFAITLSGEMPKLLPRKVRIPKRTKLAMSKTNLRASRSKPTV